MAANKSVLITGTSKGGIGSAVAFEYQKRGYTVFATTRNTSKIDSKLAKLHGVEIVQLDVTSQESIKAAAKHIESRTNGRLDVLINNSGMGYTMPLADIDLQAARAVYDVNVWGLLATTQEFLPLLVSSKGTIVNISSVAGLFRIPTQGIYNSSKSAVTMISEILRQEMKPFGVRVVTVVSGGVKSEFFNNVDSSGLPESSMYQPMQEGFINFSNGTDLRKHFPKTDVYASRLVKDIENGAIGKIWRGKSSTLTRYLMPILPTYIIDRIGARISGLDQMYR